jgi:hypothetical protein
MRSQISPSKFRHNAPISEIVLVFGRRQQGASAGSLTGVQKAPRHEVAGSWAPAEQRALWGFNVAADLDG